MATTMHCAPYLDDLRVGNGRRVEAGFVSPSVEQSAHIFYRAHTTTHRERDENLAGHGFDDVQDHVTAVAGGSDVEESQLVCTLLVVTCRDFDRVSGIAQFDKVNAFDNATAGHVEARDDAFGQHGGLFSNLSGPALASAASLPIARPQTR
jgi:hypothetical protein